MKIRGICQRDGREFLVQQVIDSHGHCPWDGKPFQADYTATLTKALVAAEEAGTRLEEALEALSGVDPDLVLVEDSILGRIQGYLEDLRRGTRPRVPLPRV
ncbi:MAG: hypothetical protein HY658_15125 [Actinobacteria bacterium]|nr:hypothetical protein [Actinomycetota bacterium]